MRPFAVFVAVAVAVSLAGLPSFAGERTCRVQAGYGVAMSYVHDCIMMSPATNPPCNEANPCWMIVGEVVRGCDMGVRGEAMCRKYRKLQKRYPAPVHP